MIVEQIQAYTTRKELSNKAKKEVLEILKQINYNDRSELKQIITALFNLNPEVLYEFISMLDMDQSNMVANAFDCKNANKTLHICVAVIACARIGNDKKSNEVLETFIFENAFVKKVNKQIFIGLGKAIALDTSNFLSRECAEWKPRNINGFRKIWVEAAEYLQNDKFSNAALQWFENNGIVPTQTEARLLHLGQEKVSAKSENSKSLDNSSIDDLIVTLAKKVKVVSDDAKCIKTERDELIAQSSSLKNELLKAKQDLSQAQAVNRKLLSEKEICEKNNEALTKEVATLDKRMADIIEENKTLKIKLDNVESAYGQAGQTEIDSLVSRIKGRLSSEYCKYQEIKTKEPDMDYYEILLAMLDEVYRVLKKNGITF